MLDFYSHYAIMEKPTSIVEMLEGSNLNRSLRGATAMAKSKRTANPREVKKCSVLGCDEPHEAKELCRKHYQQIKRWGRLFSGIKEPNQIIHDGDTTYIILCDRQGLEKARAVIDSNDLQQVSQFKWHMHPASPPGPFYAVTSLGNNKYMKLHHLILGKKCETDHRDRNGLNNCRENLREAAPWQNSCNRVRSIKYSRTGYRGVYQCWSHGKLLDRYWAEIRANGKRTGLGRFITPEEAARTYDVAAIRLHGEFATLNFPQPSQGEQP